MQKIYVLEGLDCANCAMKIERQVAKVKGVQETNVDFVTKKLYVEYEDATIEEAILSTVTCTCTGRQLLRTCTFS